MKLLKKVSKQLLRILKTSKSITEKLINKLSEELIAGAEGIFKSFSLTPSARVLKGNTERFSKDSPNGIPKDVEA